MNFYKYTFSIKPLQPNRDVLTAELCEIEFDSFEETDNGLIAYSQKDNRERFFENLLSFSMEGSKIEWEKELVQNTMNWNEEWEKNFSPIEVEDLCFIRAPFHKSKKGFKQEVIIQPQMSFGTGHHQTTWLICRELFGLDLNGKSLLDMGCGTGVLAILAEKLGAVDILAIDNDEWSYKNTLENLELNKSFDITVIHGDKHSLGKQNFDIILANINRNILLSDMDSYEAVLNPGGVILFSGFYTSDKDYIVNKAEELGLSFYKMESKDDWAMVAVRKEP